MAKATVKDGTIFIEVPFSVEGSVSKSRKSIIHATTEQGTPDALTIEHGGKKIIVQVNAYSKRIPGKAPAIK